MINSIIAAFVAIFFWGRSSKDIEEKTRRASKLRTFVYFVLSIIVGCFFYKTYQVTTIMNGIQVTPLISEFDSLGHSVDTIPTIEIFNHFSTSGNYKNDIYKISRAGDEKRSDFAEVGGIRLTIEFPNNPSYKKKLNPVMPEYALNEIEIPFKNPDHAYFVGFMYTGITNIFPFFPKIDYESGWELVGNQLYGKIIVGNLRDNDEIYITTDKSQWYEYTPSQKPFPGEGQFFGEYLVSKRQKGVKPYTNFYTGTTTEYANTFNFFTAADISQYTHMIVLNTDCHVSKIYLDYDLPIEMIGMEPRIKVGTKGIEINGELIDEMKGQFIMLHVKLPTLANLQLIRSLILTTLITALISLFFRNLYFLIRRWAVRYKKKHKLSYAEAKLINRCRVKLFRKFMYCIIIAILLLLLYMTYFMLTDSPFTIPMENVKIYMFSILGAIILIMLVIFLLYRYMTKPVSPNNVIENSENISTIFIHERDEDEEYDEMVKEMYSEGDYSPEEDSQGEETEEELNKSIKNKDEDFVE